MLLCIDVGNTNTMLGVYEGSGDAAELGPHWRLETNHERMPDEYAMQLLAFFDYANLDPKEVHGVAIASGVPPLTSKWNEVCSRYLGHEPLVVHGQMQTDLTILYDNPASVGADRVVDAVAAFKRYGGPLCIVDFGTATTFEAVTKKGEYLGGAIVPGINISANALYERAAALPKVAIDRPPSAIGRNTTHAMQSGLLFGYVSLVEGMVARFKAELGEGTKVVGTGGLAPIIAAETDVIEIIEPWLTLDGLRMIYELNAK